MRNKVNKEEAWCKCYKAHAEIINSQNGMARTFVTAVRAAAKESTKNVLVLVYPADFLKTNLTKYTVIWVKRRQKAGFFKPDKVQNHSEEGKEKEKKKERREGKEEKRKKAMVALLVYIIATLEFVFGRKKL